jgi:hypothetical protein
MDDKMWTTETETINDGDARVLFQAQMRRRMEELDRRERRRVGDQVANWQGQERELRERMLQERMLRAEWPESGKSELEEILFGRKDKKEKDKILKPLPDELFEID